MRLPVSTSSNRSHLLFFDLLAKSTLGLLRPTEGRRQQTDGWVLSIFNIQSLLTGQSKLLMTYKHLIQAVRYQINALRKAGSDPSQTAKLQ